MSKSKNPTSWEPVAGWYDELLAGNDTYQAKVILPNLLRLLPPAGKKVIDIACGQGFFSKMYAEGGAKEVLGVDISPELIKIARTGGGATRNLGADGSADVGGAGMTPTRGVIRFEVAPVSKISVAKNDSFDAGFIILALQNIKELTETIKEAARVIRKGGELVIVLNHPCFRILKASAWGYDEKEKVQYRRIDKYGRPFMTEVDMTPGTDSRDKKVHTVSFHRPLQDYFKALAGAGFVVTSLEEWISHKKSETGPRAIAEDEARKEFPMFLTIVARK